MPAPAHIYARVNVRRVFPLSRMSTLRQRPVFVRDGAHKQHHTKKESEVVHEIGRRKRELLSLAAVFALLTDGKGGAYTPWCPNKDCHGRQESPQEEVAVRPLGGAGAPEALMASSLA